MAGIYTDENMSLALEGLLLERGHAVTSTYAEGRAGAPDPHQLLFAAERRWTLVTHNRRDYRLLHDAWHLWSRAWGVARHHAGILVIEQVAGQPATELAALIDALVADPTTSLTNALYDWKPAAGWKRFPA